MTNSVAMPVDPRKVNLAEKDIEDWLYQNPTAIKVSYWGDQIVEWIARQYTLPSGIADLIGVREDGIVVVVEVKNVEISKAAILQVCRYAYDLGEIVSRRMNYPTNVYGSQPVERVVIGPSIDGQTFYEAVSCGVMVVTFAVSMNLTLGSNTWTREYDKHISAEHERLASQLEWNRYGLTIEEDIERWRAEERQANAIEDEIAEHLPPDTVIDENHSDD